MQFSESGIEGVEMTVDGEEGTKHKGEVWDGEEWVEAWLPYARDEYRDWLPKVDVGVTEVGGVSSLIKEICDPVLRDRW